MNHVNYDIAFTLATCLADQSSAHKGTKHHRPLHPPPSSAHLDAGAALHLVRKLAYILRPVVSLIADRQEHLLLDDTALSSGNSGHRLDSGICGEV